MGHSRRTLCLALLIPAVVHAQQADTAVFAARLADTSACAGYVVPTSSGAARDTSRPAPANNSVQAGRGPAIILRASATAREVRFATEPRIMVRMCGGVVDSVRVLERRNLPDPVQPGTTYRDVYIAVEVLGHLHAQCLASRLDSIENRRERGACAALQLRDTSGSGGRRSSP
jgi:hypothetical protein